MTAYYLRNKVEGREEVEEPEEHKYHDAQLEGKGETVL